MNKIDFKKELKHLYKPSAKKVSIVDVPTMNFLMIDGQGNPNTVESYGQAVEALYAVSYALKFMIKKGALAVDYGVMPLEGFWWGEDMNQFSVDSKDDWLWTAMIMQPEYVTEELVNETRQLVETKKNPPALPLMRFEPYDEGQAAQILYTGPYADEAPTIQRIHQHIEDNGGQLQGKHHEIYLNDPRRTATEKLKTVIRQPYK